MAGIRYRYFVFSRVYGAQEAYVFIQWAITNCNPSMSSDTSIRPIWFGLYGRTAQMSKLAAFQTFKADRMNQGTKSSNIESIIQAIKASSTGFKSSIWSAHPEVSLAILELHIFLDQYLEVLLCQEEVIYLGESHSLLDALSFMFLFVSLYFP